MEDYNSNRHWSLWFKYIFHHHQLLVLSWVLSDTSFLPSSEYNKGWTIFAQKFGSVPFQVNLLLSNFSFVTIKQNPFALWFCLWRTICGSLRGWWVMKNSGDMWSSVTIDGGQITRVECTCVGELMYEVQTQHLKTLWVIFTSLWPHSFLFIYFGLSGPDINGYAFEVFLWSVSNMSMSGLTRPIFTPLDTQYFFLQSWMEGISRFIIVSLFLVVFFIGWEH
jgi:hypothetical protein